MNSPGTTAPAKGGFLWQWVRWTEGVLPLVLLLCFVIAAALGLYALSFLRTLLVSERGRELAMNAGGVANTFDRVMFERFSDIQLFSKDGVLQTGNRTEKTARLEQYKQLYRYYSWLGVADENGQLVAATDALPAQGTSALSAESFEEVRRTGKVHFEAMRPSPDSPRELTVGFTAPIYGSQGEFRGVVAAKVPFESLRTVFEQEGRPRYSDVAHDWLLLDREGTVLSEKSHQPELIGTRVKFDLPAQVRAAAERHEPGFMEEVDPRRGVRVVSGYAWTQGYGNFRGFDWLILLRMDHHQVHAPVDRLLWMVGGIGLSVVLPLTGYGIWVSWKLGHERNQLVKARQDLEQLVTELGRSNADLQQFAYVASHDLQEPLRMVSSYTQLLGRRYKGKLDADADEFIGFAVDGANRMQRLIQDLLAYSRVSRGNYQPEEISVEEALSDALDNLRRAMDESGAVVTHDRLPTVAGDRSQCTQLFQNLLSNAIKFRGQEPPRIHVAAKRTGSEWLFSIRDNGIGVDPQYADRIFVIFQRLHTTQEFAGTGIGLAICKKIVERHEGRIWVESEPGKGTVFYFTIPDRTSKS